MSKVRTISNELRDTHFKNYARIVFDEVEDMFMKLANAPEAEKAQITNDIQLALARRLYDLACHVADEVVGGSNPDYFIGGVSDYPLRSDYPKKKEGE